MSTTPPFTLPPLPVTTCVTWIINLPPWLHWLLGGFVILMVAFLLTVVAAVTRYVLSIR